MVTKAEWAERVKRWSKSGLDRKGFAASEGIDAQQLSWWRWKLGPVAAATLRPEPMRFLPARVVGDVVTMAAAESPIEIVLGNGCVVRVSSGFDAASLARVLRIAAKEGASC